MSNRQARIWNRTTKQGFTPPIDGFENILAASYPLKKNIPNRKAWDGVMIQYFFKSY
jgi:hypothetical protein